MHPKTVFYVLPIVLLAIIIVAFIMDVALLAILPWLLFAFALGVGFYLIAKGQASK